MIPTRQTRNSEGKIGYSRLPVRQCLFLPIRPVHAAEYLDAAKYSAAAEYLDAAEYWAALLNIRQLTKYSAATEYSAAANIHI